MAHNVAVVGAVIHLGATHAAQTFAATMSHQAALVRGFEIDEQACLLSAKSHLMHVSPPLPEFDEFAHCFTAYKLSAIERPMLQQSPWTHGGCLVTTLAMTIAHGLKFTSRNLSVRVL